VALIPAYTFIATATAAVLAGYEPVFVDVDEKTWTADPLALLDHPDLARTGVVIPVAAYGRPVPLAEWTVFQERTGVPVVVDAAAAFDTLLRDPARYLGGGAGGPEPPCDQGLEYRRRRRRAQR
jgi:dTDP-4-amino-4,6-dideoxygalactose transaminase